MQTKTAARLPRFALAACLALAACEKVMPRPIHQFTVACPWGPSATVVASHYFTGNGTHTFYRQSEKVADFSRECSVVRKEG